MWIYEGSEFKEEDAEKAIEDGYVGFVYEITDTTNGKKYIGKKNLLSVRRLKPLKGKKRKRIVKKQSDWQDYYGSSEAVKLLVEENGKDFFKREILILCRSKGMMSYEEARLQFEKRVLFDDKYYNEFIGCKIHSKHVKGKE